MSIPGIEAWFMPFIASSGLVGACGDGLRAGVGFPCRRSCFFTPGFFATAFLAVGFCGVGRSEAHTSELQSLMRNSYAVFCLEKKKKHRHNETHTTRPPL